jgi:hypothetical protein
LLTRGVRWRFVGVVALSLLCLSLPRDHPKCHQVYRQDLSVCLRRAVWSCWSQLVKFWLLPSLDRRFTYWTVGKHLT